MWLPPCIRPVLERSRIQVCLYGCRGASVGQGAAALDNRGPDGKLICSHQGDYPPSVLRFRCAAQAFCAAKRESGENPERARRCDPRPVLRGPLKNEFEQFFNGLPGELGQPLRATVLDFWMGRPLAGKESQKTCRKTFRPAPVDQGPQGRSLRYDREIPGCEHGSVRVFFCFTPGRPETLIRNRRNEWTERR